MDPLNSERALSFGEPSHYSSRDFITVHQSERPSDTQRWWTPGSSVNISIKNVSQNEFLDVNDIFVQFSVLTTVAKPTSAATDAAKSLHLNTKRDAAAIYPGVPAFGCPFFSNVSVQVPGLGLDSFLKTDTVSQVNVASRLMCSSASGKFIDSDVACSAGFEMDGKPFAAGARSAVSRADCVCWEGLPSNRNGTFAGVTGTTVQAPDEAAGSYGSLAHYSVPLAVFSFLANSTSSLLPVAFLSSGGDIMNITLKLAPAATALCNVNADRVDLAGAATYYIVDPCLSFTKVQINSPSVLAGIERLYRGLESVPIAPGLEAPISMVLKTVNYMEAITSISASAGNFQLSIPANEPSCRGVMLKIMNNGNVVNAGLSNASAKPSDAAVEGSEWSGKHAFSVAPQLENLQIRIGSYRVPLDALSDHTATMSTPPTGLSTNPLTGIFGAFTGYTVSVSSAKRELQRLYQMGRHLFSPFASEEDPHVDPLAPFWARVGHGQAPSVRIFGGYHCRVYNDAAYNASYPDWVVCGSDGLASNGDKLGSAYKINEMAQPNLYVLPFESFPAVYNMRDDAYACRGVDLRNITSVIVSGRINGVDQGSVGGVSQANPVSCDGWSIYGWLAFDQLSSILPGRIEISSQFSLLPTGSTAVPPVQ